jgi:hypothetical protein
VLDEMGGYYLPGFRVFALAGLHDVAHQDLDVQQVAGELCADFHWFCHFLFLSLFKISVLSRRSRRW